MSLHFTRHHPPPRLEKWISIVLPLATFAGLVPILYGELSLVAEGKKRMAVMCGISYGVRMYRNDHRNELPKRLSELSPLYSNPSTFFQDEPANHWFRPATLDRAGLIDVFSPYALLPLPGGAFVIYEKPGPRKDPTIGYITAGTDRGECQGRVPPELFADLIVNNFGMNTPPPGKPQSESQ